MEFFRKGGGGVTQSITLRHIFVPQELRFLLFKIEGYRHFYTQFLKKYFKYGHFRCFWELMFFTFLVTKNQMCLTGSITSKNKGGRGVRPTVGNIVPMADGIARQV